MEAHDNTTSSPVLALVLGLLVAAFLYLFSTRGRQTLPPGPKQLPFLGNVHQLPAIDQHKTFAQWGEQYGERVSTSNIPLTLNRHAMRQAT